MQTEVLPKERQQEILARLSRDGRVLAGDLARDFGTSGDTIRRDLRELAAAGLCRRVYGGALPISPASDPAAVRRDQAPARKAALGAVLATLVRPGQVVFLDAGSTNLAAAQALARRSGDAARAMTAATHDPAIAASLVGLPGIELILIGGRVDPGSGAALGAGAMRAVAELRPDLLLLGVCALDAEGGIGAFGYEDAEMKRLLVRCARTVAAAVTDDKLGTGAPHLVASTGALSDLVVEASAPEAPLQPLLARGVRIHRAATVKEA